MTAAGNPFTPMRPAEIPPAEDAVAFARFGVIYSAEALWDLLDTLPGKAEAKLSQRRLEETVFWANQAAGSRS